VKQGRVDEMQRAFGFAYQLLSSKMRVQPIPQTLRIYDSRETFLDDLRRVSGLDEQDASFFRHSGAPRPHAWAVLCPAGFHHHDRLHELTHAFIQALSGNAYLNAKWFDEGFASYIGFEYCPPPTGWPSFVGPLIP